MTTQEPTSLTGAATPKAWVTANHACFGLGQGESGWVDDSPELVLAIRHGLLEHHTEGPAEVPAAPLTEAQEAGRAAWVPRETTEALPFAKGGDVQNSAEVTLPAGTEVTFASDPAEADTEGAPETLDPVPETLTPEPRPRPGPPPRPRQQRGGSRR